MADIVPPFPVGAPFDSYNAVDWYQKVRIAINNSSNISWGQITDFSGSDLSQLVTRNYSDLQGIPINSATIPLAALTLSGTQGSITVVNGLITAFVAPT